MKVYVLIISDCEMRPRYDITTTAVFAKREDALAAMEHDIANAIENELIVESEIERYPDVDFAVSTDERFMWKVEQRTVSGSEK
jgi:hypothetical protein